MNGTQTTQSALLGRVLERNRAFVAGREARPLPPAETLQLAVVACYDPRLDPLLVPALGLDAGRTFLFRSAGALVQPAGATMRSLAMAVYMFGVTEILVVGHSSCRMAAFKGSEFIELFRRRGVSREAFGAGDLREWAGAIASSRRGVEISVGNITTAPFLPRDLTVGGLVLDDASGALEVVVEPGATPQPAAETAAESTAAGAVDADAEASQETPHAEPTRESEPAQLSPDLDPLLREATGFARLVRSKEHWRHDLEQLRQELGQPHHAIVKYRALEKFARRASTESREVSDAFERLRRAALDAKRTLESDDVLRLLRRVLGRR